MKFPHGSMEETVFGGIQLTVALALVARLSAKAGA